MWLFLVILWFRDSVWFRIRSGMALNRYGGYVQYFRACVLVPRSQSDCTIVWVAETSSMSAKAKYMRLALLPCVLICSCLGWLKRCEHVCVCAVCNWCVFGVCSVLWCIDYFTGFYNKLLLMKERLYSAFDNSKRCFPHQFERCKLKLSAYGLLKMRFWGRSDFGRSGPMGLGFNLCVAPAL